MSHYINFATLYPVGSIMIYANNTNPNDLYIGTTWVRIANGRTLVGVDESDSVTLMKTGGNAGGSTNPLTQHSHSAWLIGYSPTANTSGFNWQTANAGSYAGADSDTIRNAGSNTNHANWQPFFTVYFWQRTA